MKNFKTKAFFPIFSLILGVVVLTLNLPKVHSTIFTDVPDEKILIYELFTKKLVKADEDVRFSDSIVLDELEDGKVVGFQCYPIFDKKDDRFLTRFVARDGKAFYASDMEKTRRQDIWYNVNGHIFIKDIKPSVYGSDFAVALTITAEKESPKYFIIFSLFGIVFTGIGLIFILPALDRREYGELE